MTTTDQAANAAQPATKLLLIETQSPWQSGDSADFLKVAATLLEAGTPVHLHFIQNGVMWVAQDTAALDGLRQGHPACLHMSFDEVSLDLRGIPHSQAAAHGPVNGMDKLVAEMADPQVKTIWHS